MKTKTIAAIAGLSIGILIGGFGTVWVVSGMRSPQYNALPVDQI